MKTLIGIMGIVLIAIVACIVLFLIELGIFCLLIFIFASMFILIIVETA